MKHWNFPVIEDSLCLTVIVCDCVCVCVWNEEIILFQKQRKDSYLRRHMWGLQAKFMHDPTCFDAIWSSIPIEHQSLSHPYYLPWHWVQHCTVLPCGFPVARCRCPIGPEARGIFAVSEAEEVPFSRIEFSHLCRLKKKHSFLKFSNYMNIAFKKAVEWGTSVIAVVA